MAKLFGKSGRKFNATGKDDMDNFDPIPANEWVIASITKSEVKSNSNETGKVTSFVWKVLEGKFKGRMIFTNLNLEHENEDAEKMAEKELATMCRAMGKGSTDVEDTEELHGIPVNLQVKIQKGTKGYPDRNAVKTYKRVDGGGSPDLKRKESDKDDSPVKERKRPTVNF